MKIQVYSLHVMCPTIPTTTIAAYSPYSIRNCKLQRSKPTAYAFHEPPKSRRACPGQSHHVVGLPVGWCPQQKWSEKPTHLIWSGWFGNLFGSFCFTYHKLSKPIRLPIRWFQVVQGLQIATYSTLCHYVQTTAATEGWYVVGIQFSWKNKPQMLACRNPKVYGVESRLFGALIVLLKQRQSLLGTGPCTCPTSRSLAQSCPPFHHLTIGSSPALK